MCWEPSLCWSGSLPLTTKCAPVEVGVAAALGLVRPFHEHAWATLCFWSHTLYKAKLSRSWVKPVVFYELIVKSNLRPVGWLCKCIKQSIRYLWKLWRINELEDVSEEIGHNVIKAETKRQTWKRVTKNRTESEGLTYLKVTGE